MKTEIEKVNEENQRLRGKLNGMHDLLKSKEAEERVKKSLDFVQVSKSSLRALSKLKPLSLEILMTFAQAMNRQNAVMMSYETMASLTNYKRNALSKAIKELQAEQWLQIIKVGTANAYVLNSEVFWTTANNKKEYATFSAQIITSLDEQNSKDIRKCKDLRLKTIPSIEPSDPDLRVILKKKINKSAEDNKDNLTPKQTDIEDSL
jgi:hypothetical protein